MTNLLGVTPAGNGQVTIKSSPLGRGGEGSVHAVESHSIPTLPQAENLVAKLYHSPEDGNRRAKLKAMINSSVSNSAVAWPQALVLDVGRNFKGYIMPKLDTATSREWLYLANAKERNKIAPEFDTRYAFMSVRNLAAAMLAVHEAGHRIGDINESNIFVKSDASVLLVDSDSMQIAGPDGEIYPCLVGKQEYTAPELSHGSLRDNPRTIESDIFAFAVASYQLLTGGATPHQGSFDPNNPDDPLSTVERIRKGILPSLNPSIAKSFGFTPRPGVPTRAFPNFLIAHLLAFLSPRPEERISDQINVNSFIKEIDSYVSKLVRCSKEKLHWHLANEACLWCASADEMGIDPWAAQLVRESPAQISLPPVTFGENALPASQARRAAPAVAGQQAHQANQQASGVSSADPLQQLLSSNNPVLQAAAAAYMAQSTTGRQQTPAQQRPKKIRGKVTVEYADGTWGVRPPLSQLIFKSPRIAFWAIKEETWGLFKFWWPVERKLGNVAGLITGFLLGLGLVFLNWQTAITILSSFDFMGDSAIFWGSMLPAITSLFVVAFLFASGLRDRVKTKKRYGNLTQFKEESPVFTIFRYIAIAVFYGLPALAIVIIGGLFTLLNELFMEERRRP